MEERSFDRLARALTAQGTRRRLALVGAAVVLITGAAAPGGARQRRDRPRRDRDSGRKRNEDDKAKRKRDKNRGRVTVPFARNCDRFVISAGPSPNDKFKHIDDDLHIELIAKGKRGGIRVLLRDDNNSPNGPDGDHLRVEPFEARVGDRIHIVARNEVSGGCELDAIWLHCTQGGNGRVKLTDRITPEECRNRANSVGVFFEKMIRIKSS